MTEPGAVAGLVAFGIGLVSLVLVRVIWKRWKIAEKLADKQLNLVGQLRQQISEKDLLVADLTTSSEQLRAEFDGLSGAIWDFDVQAGRLSVSDLFLDVTGFNLQDLPQSLELFPELIHPDDFPAAREALVSYLAGRSAHCGLELRFKFSDQEYHWVQSRVLVSRNSKGDPVRVVGSLVDISEKVLAEEERDRLFNLSVDMLSVGGFDGSFHQLNPAWVRVLGWSRDDILGELLPHFIHEQDQAVIEKAFQQLREGDPVRGAESRFRCRDGNYRWLSWSSFPYPDHELVFSVVRDVTEQKIAATRVLEYQDRLRSLSSQLALVEDRQRQELATAIHDGLAQQLFAIRAQVTLLKFPEMLDDYQAQIQEIMDILDDTMRDARNLSFELFPPVLHEVGLDAALVWLAHQFQQRTGLHCDVRVDGEEKELPEDLRAMVYQSVRELLNNVYKHAEATEVAISVSHIPGSLTLLVDDNGVGFEVSTEQSSRARQESGFGLFSIRERLRSVGGRVRVDSRPGEGCRVFLSIPRTP